MDKIEQKLNRYPDIIQEKIRELRNIILNVAQRNSEIDFIGEDLKWGELSFMTKSSGSTIRIDWKEKSPKNLSLYVNCQTKLIKIFKELYPDDFEYVGNRELRLPLDDVYPKDKFEKCVELALIYNLIKSEF